MTLVNAIETGAYTGNGTSQSISIGWQPGFVFSISSKAGGNPNQRGGAFKTSDMASDNSIRSRQGTAYTTGLITLVADGFDVGADDSVNRSGEVYHWVAVRAGPTFDAAAFTGADPTDTALVLNRQPALLFHFNQTTPHVALKHPLQAGDLFWNYSSAVGSANGLTIDAAGFTASGTPANSSGEAMNYSSFYELVGANQHWECGEYTGDGNATQAISLGRQPKFLMIITPNNNAALKIDTMAGDSAGSILSSTNYLASLVALGADGFTADLNLNAAASNYLWVAWYH